MSTHLPEASDRIIENLEQDLALLEEGLPSEEELGELKEEHWKKIKVQCFTVDDHLQVLHIQCGFRRLHEMQEEHVLGLTERFERLVDHLLLHSDTCPDYIYRAIAHYGVLTRARSYGIMELQELRRQRNMPDDNPFDLLNESSDDE